MKKYSHLTKRCLTLLCYCLAYTYCLGNQSAKELHELASPDKQTKIRIYESNGTLAYEILHKSVSVIEPSEMVWSVGSDTLGKKVTDIRLVERFKTNKNYPTRGGHSLAHDRSNGYLLKIKDARDFRLEVRVFNDGVAWRYLCDNNQQVTVDDMTTFSLPHGVTLWNQPAINNYEGDYLPKLSGELNPGDKFGCVTTIKYAGGDIYAVISEADLFDFGGMSLIVKDEKTFQANISGTCMKSGQIKTPFRVVITGNLNEVVNSDLVSNVSTEAEVNPNEKWIKPGRSVWSWLTNKPAVTFENMKRYSKMASELGFEYNLVDEGWGHWRQDGKGKWELMKELVEYSDSLGVKVWVWKAYPDRRGIEGIYDAGKRRAFFAKCREIGVVGLKIDFFDNESQEIIRFYEDALRDAAAYGLMISFHGANKPAGQSRRFPNEMTREAIRGMENMPAWAPHNMVLPYTRMVVGHADYTPLILPEKNSTGKDNRQTKRVGEISLSQHIASAIVFYSPFLCYGVNPEDLLASPVKDFVCSIPTVWDETRVLPGSEIGKSVVLARRKGKEWYIAVQTLKSMDTGITLDFLGKVEYCCQSIEDVEGRQQEVNIMERTVGKNDTLKVKTNRAGGFVARISPLKQALRTRLISQTSTFKHK